MNNELTPNFILVYILIHSTYLEKANNKQLFTRSLYIVTSSTIRIVIRGCQTKLGLAFASWATLLPNISGKLWGHWQQQVWRKVGLHHSEVPSIDQRKSQLHSSLPLSQSLGCIVRANILFSRSFAHIYGSSQSYWCSQGILDAVGIYGFLDLLQEKIFLSPTSIRSHPTRNILGLFGNSSPSHACRTIMLQWLVLTPPLA